MKNRYFSSFVFILLSQQTLAGLADVELKNPSTWSKIFSDDRNTAQVTSAVGYFNSLSDKEVQGLADTMVRSIPATQDPNNPLGHPDTQILFKGYLNLVKQKGPQVYEMLNRYAEFRKAIPESLSPQEKTERTEMFWASQPKIIELEDLPQNSMAIQYGELRSKMSVKELEDFYSVWHSRVSKVEDLQKLLPQAYITPEAHKEAFATLATNLHLIGNAAFKRDLTIKCIYGLMDGTMSEREVYENYYEKIYGSK